MAHWLRLHLPMQGRQVRSLVRELRSHMAHGQENQNIKQKQYCNKFNKDLKKKAWRWGEDQRLEMGENT